MRYNYSTIGTKPDAADRWLQENGIKNVNRKVKRSMQKAIDKNKRVEKVKQKDTSKDWRGLFINNPHDKKIYKALEKKAKYYKKAL